MRLLMFAILAVALLASDRHLLSQSAGDFKLTDDEALILELTNAARKEEKVGPLTVNQTLTKCARLHSANQAKQMKMAHELDGKSPADRVKAIGYAYRNMGENVAYGEGAVSVQQIFEGWMKSEGHRKNILKPEFTEIGIGISIDGRKTYYTQVFGRPLR